MFRDRENDPFKKKEEIKVIHDERKKFLCKPQA
jgi:hypothetical protein